MFIYHYVTPDGRCVERLFRLADRLAGMEAVASVDLHWRTSAVSRPSPSRASGRVDHVVLTVYMRTPTPANAAAVGEALAGLGAEVLNLVPVSGCVAIRASIPLVAQLASESEVGVSQVGGSDGRS